MLLLWLTEIFFVIFVMLITWAQYNSQIQVAWFIPSDIQYMKQKRKVWSILLSYSIIYFIIKLFGPSRHNSLQVKAALIITDSE